MIFEFVLEMQLLVVIQLQIFLISNLSFFVL